VKTYFNIDAMWQQALNDLTHDGAFVSSRNGACREIVGWAGRLSCPDRNVLTNKRRAISPAYAMAELAWYLSRTDNVSMMLPYAPQYEKFTEPGTTQAYGAYGHRVATNVPNCDLLELALKELTNPKASRQVVIALWQPSDLLEVGGKRNDLPCTLTWQFMLRDDGLHMAASMRSQDVWLGMPYDVFVNTCVQRLMANSLGVSCGTYVHYVGSMHLYTKHSLAALQALSSSAAPANNGWSVCQLDTLASAPLFVDNLLAQQQTPAAPMHSGGRMLYDFTATLTQHWHGASAGAQPTSIALKRALENYVNHRGSGSSRQDHTR
jgi:Thymidylate synthase